MIINKKDYILIKNYVKSLCLDNVKDLCNKVGLNEYETNLMVYTNQNETRVYAAMQLGVCESKVSKDRNKIFRRIKDYLKRNNIEY